MNLVEAMLVGPSAGLNMLVAVVVAIGTTMLLRFALSNRRGVLLSPGEINRPSLISAGLRGGFIAAYESCEFEATAGGRIRNYFDADRLLMTNPACLGELSDRIVDVLSKYPNAKVCFTEKDSGPVGMLGMQALITYKIGRPTSTIRMCRDVLSMVVKGQQIVQGDEVVLVQDVVRTGRQIAETSELLERFGATVVGAIVLVDREESRSEVFREKKIELFAMMPLSEVIAGYSKQDHAVA